MPILFLAVATILLSLAVYFSYFLLKDFLRAGLIGKVLILLFLIITSFGFILTLSWSRAADNQLVHMSYIIFAFALGFLFYLTIFGILYRIVHIFKFKYTLFTKPSIFILATLLFFAAGIYGAYFTKVKEVSISLPNLPLNWQGKKIVQLSDLHLGNIYGPNFLKRLTSQVNNLNPDLIVITGDLFDGTDNRFAEFTPLFSDFQAKYGVVFVMGNHDTYLDADLIEKTLEFSGATVLRDEALFLDGLEIIGLDFNNSDEPVLIDGLDYINKNGPRILLKHLPVKPSFSNDLQIDLQLSGHSHRGQMFPLSLLTRLIYGKYHYGLQVGVDYQMQTSSGVGSWGPPLRTFNQSEIVLIELN